VCLESKRYFRFCTCNIHFHVGHVTKDLYFCWKQTFFKKWNRFLPKYIPFFVITAHIVVVVPFHFLFQFLTEHNSDEEWKLDIICDALSQRRPGEKYIVLPDYYDKVSRILQCYSIWNIFVDCFKETRFPILLPVICNQRQYLIVYETISKGHCEYCLYSEYAKAV